MVIRSNNNDCFVKTRQLDSSMASHHTSVFKVGSAEIINQLNQLHNMKEDNFFPSEDYKVPVTSDYLNKFAQGDTTFRVLSSAIVGYEYFNRENKPIRSEEPFDSTPSDMKPESAIKHFWAFVIWNYEAERIQILELTQKSIMTSMKALIDNTKWGNPKGYDITISRKGSTMNDTEYSVMPNPHTDLSEKIKDAFLARPVNLEALYTGEDPFKA